MLLLLIHNFLLVNDLRLPHLIPLKQFGALLSLKKEGFLKEFIVCSFYSPPGNGKNSKLVDHIVGTIQELCTKYPNSGIFICGDKNGMDIKPILNSGLKLKQIVDKPTRKGKILDVIITNIGK